MLIALTTNNQPVTAHRTLNKKDDYYCPSCKTPVHLKLGEIMRPHFAHYRLEECTSFSEGETAAHLKGKVDLFNCLKRNGYRVQLEAYLPQLQQRPDILINDLDKKIAIEYQCSSISIQKIIERTRGYQQANYQVIWILGEDFSYHKKLTNQQKASLYYSSLHNHLFLLNYQAATEKLSVHYNFQINSKGKMTSQINQTSLKDLQIKSFFTGFMRDKKEKISKTCLLTEHTRLLRTIRYPNADMRAFLALLYQHGDDIVSAPIEIYRHLPNEWFYQNYHMHWKYQFIKWLESLGQGHLITKEMLKKWLAEAIDQENIQLAAIQVFTSDLILKPVMEFIDYLVTRNIVKQIEGKKWIYQQAVKKFNFIEEKLQEKEGV